MSALPPSPFIAEGRPPVRQPAPSVVVAFTSAQYASNRVFDGKRPLSSDDVAKLRENYHRPRFVLDGEAFLAAIEHRWSDR